MDWLFCVQATGENKLRILMNFDKMKIIIGLLMNTEIVSIKSDSSASAKNENSWFEKVK